MKKMDLEELQVRLSDERFEGDPFPSEPWGVTDPWNTNGWGLKKSFRKCNECKRPIPDRYNSDGFCGECRWRPCVYRCGNKVGPKNRICESCMKRMAEEDKPPPVPRKKKRKT